MDKRILIRGSEVQQGTYLLHLHVASPLTLVFGRYQGGKGIAVPVGEYLYIGSAMGVRGSGTLARRVLRHTVRGGGRPAHEIQADLLGEFARVGLGGKGVQPPPEKKLRWHIDYLLAETAVDIRHIFLWRSEQAQERPLARLVNRMPGTEPLARGLGASDDPGVAHILRLKRGYWPRVRALAMESPNDPV